MMIQKELYERICAWADAHADEMRADLQEFARIKSVSRADLAEPGAPFGRDCRRMLDFALEKAKSYGFETANADGYYGDAWIGEKKDAVGIIGHLDVVPEGDGWHVPPYSATRDGDFLIGRGVGDNKSACIMGLYVLRMMKEIEAPLTNGARVIFGCSEETGMQDMAHMVENADQPPVSLVPDASFPVNYAQKGTMRGEMSIALGDVLASFTGGEVRNMVPPHAQAELKLPAEQVRAALSEDFEVEQSGDGCIVKAHGRAAHAASPENGVSAIYLLSTALAESGLLDAQGTKAMRAFSALCSDTTGANAGIACEDPESGKTTMVCGVAKTENGTVSLSLDCRLSIAADLEANEKNFRAFAEGLGCEVSGLATGKPFYIPKDDPRIEMLLQVCRDVLGMENPQPYTMGGGTYSRVVPNAITFGSGLRGSPRMETEPGHGGAHQPDEFVYFPNLVTGLKALACAVILLDRLV